MIKERVDSAFYAPFLGTLFEKWWVGPTCNHIVGANVKIPQSFYFRFRWKHTLWAFASGMFLGYLSLVMTPLAMFIPSGAALLVFIFLWGVAVAVLYQCVFHQYFSGKRRGEFEYVYLEDLLHTRTKDFLIPNDQEKWELSCDPMALNYKFLEKIEKTDDPERRFLLFMALAFQCFKADEYKKIIEYSKEALAYKPDDVVANFMLAEALEVLGEGLEAVKSYEAALQDPRAQSPPLERFITAQIERVKTKGPRKGAKIQKGFRYMTY